MSTTSNRVFRRHVRRGWHAVVSVADRRSYQPRSTSAERAADVTADTAVENDETTSQVAPDSATARTSSVAEDSRGGSGPAQETGQKGALAATASGGLSNRFNVEPVSLAMAFVAGAPPPIHTSMPSPRSVAATWRSAFLRSSARANAIP